MASINKSYDKLASGYLFQEMARRTKEFIEKNPDKTVMKLGIGDTTEPLTSSVIKGLHEGVERLASLETYSGYGDEQGNTKLREALCEYYKKQNIDLDSSEIFISDGAKSDSANIQSIFGTDAIVAVQDPAYPVYADSNVIAGRTGQNNDGLFEGIYYMPCTEESDFFPEIPDRKVDLIYICSPNNPTGAAATKDQLKKMVDYARENKAVIIFDAAYAGFITNDDLPRSIYEIDGAKECAIEINSFSKSSGFTGVRLGWSIVPKDLVVEGEEAGKINRLWNRRQCTFFNGASNIAQAGGLAALSEEGLSENKKIIEYYLDNAKIIKKGLEGIGLICYGGENAPYIWVKTPNDMKSWDFFDKLLNETYVVGTPGSGFGPSGEGFFRLSAFGHRENIQKAVESIKINLKNDKTVTV